jgi:hypothetical protein
MLSAITTAVFLYVLVLILVKVRLKRDPSFFLGKTNWAAAMDKMANELKREHLYIYIYVSSK